MEWMLGIAAVLLFVFSYFFFRNLSTQSHHLRRELSEELQRNRSELQNALNQSSHLLEQKVSLLTDKVQNKLDANLKEGFVHFERVQSHLKATQEQLFSLNQMGKSIHDLNNLLKMPHLRGAFGELLLEQILGDLLPRQAYELQYQIVPHSTERVDAVIRYPDRVLPIDSKFPREQVLPLFESGSAKDLETARKSLTDIIRTLARSIKEKYIRPEHGTTDMALLFIPSETLYFEILQNVKLCDELGRLKVFAASPNTLAVTLHAISVSRTYYEMAKGVEETLNEVRKAQEHFDRFESRFDEIGSALSKAQVAFNTATTHLGRFSSAVTRLVGIAPEPNKKLPAPSAPLYENSQ